MKHYSEDELYKFIEGKIFEKSIINEIEQHLQNCFECFHKYIDLKEIKYFQLKGENMSKKVYSNVINMVKKNKTPKLSLIIYYTKKKLRVFSEDNFQLQSRFIDVSYAMKSGKELTNKNDAFIIFKTIGDYNVSLKILRLPDNNHFNIEIELKYKNKKAKSIRIYLNENGQELEFIDYPKTCKFNYNLEPNDYDILFFEKNKEELFSISIKLKEED